MSASNFQGLINTLEGIWQSPDGAMFLLRQGRHDTDRIDEVVRLLRSIELSETDALLPRRLVSLLWYMPAFMEWQVERVIEGGGDADALRTQTVEVLNQLERILGLP
jgi:hypothetical protein